MKTRNLAITAIAAVALIAASAIAAGPSTAHSPNTETSASQEYQGRSMGHGYGMSGSGRHMKMMGHSGRMSMMGHSGRMSMMGHGFGWKSRIADLSLEDIRTVLKAHLIMRGNDRLKLGKVEKKDDGSVTAEIVTVDDSLVRTLEFGKKHRKDKKSE